MPTIIYQETNTHPPTEKFDGVWLSSLEHPSSPPYLPEPDSVLNPDSLEEFPMPEHTNPLIASLSKMEGITDVNPKLRLSEEFFEDNISIPDQLRFRDETLVKAVAALEAKADSDEAAIQGAQRLVNEKAKDIPREQKLVEEAIWELDMILDDMVSWNAVINHRIGKLKELLSIHTTPKPF